jgi:hypothetical protein
MSLLTGCATAPAASRQAGVRTAPAADTRQIIAEFVQKLPVGSRIVATLDSGRRVRGTILKATDQAIVIQPRGRVPQPPLEIPLDQLTSVALDQSKGVGKAIAIGAAVGAGAALAVLTLLIAIYAD